MNDEGKPLACSKCTGLNTRSICYKCWCLETPVPRQYPPPYTVICHWCDGSGKDKTNIEWTCGSCHGDRYE